MKLEHTFYFQISTPEKSSRLWGNVEECGTNRRARDDNIARHAEDVICVPDEYGMDTDTHSYYLIT